MRTLFVGLLLLLVSPVRAQTVNPLTGEATSQPAMTPAERDAVTAEAKATIDEAIAMMDKKDYDAFLDRFMEPKELSKLKVDPVKYEKAKAEFVVRVDVCNKILQNAKGEEPHVESEHAVAYRTTAGENLRLKKIDGKWYFH